MFTKYFNFLLNLQMKQLKRIAQLVKYGSIFLILILAYTLWNVSLTPTVANSLTKLLIIIGGGIAIVIYA